MRSDNGTIRGDSIMRSASEIILLWTLRNALAPEPKTPSWHAKENVKVVEEPMNVEGQIRVTYYLRVSTESWGINARKFCPSLTDEAGPHL